ncbi:hypothetical protein OAD67_01280 [bacterium]|jgi:hypothetical protein|nr:hypothetical protein [bacterium]MDC1215207.1 hypothetical protein [bacterium]|tara:strand:+ start:17600 stop:17806 length:207 start_codon:yes stop_codon:yes gene_type:complete
MAAVGIAGGRITAGAGSNLLGQQAADRNQDATVYVGNLDLQVRVEDGGQTRTNPQCTKCFSDRPPRFD